jgi:hypothetical protein
MKGGSEKGSLSKIHEKWYSINAGISVGLVLWNLSRKILAA